jgi:hypothetical protein
MGDRRLHWDERHRNAGDLDPLSFLTVELGPLLPSPGTAIDVAGGRGRHAAWLNDRGWDTTVVDFSPVALDAVPDGIGTVAADLEVDLFPEGPWDLVLVVHYLHRELFPAMIAQLAPAGLIGFAVSTERNLERHERPPLPYLLGEGEAPDLVPGLRILSYAEGWSIEGRHEARLIAALSPGPSPGAAPSR